MLQAAYIKSAVPVLQFVPLAPDLDLANRCFSLVSKINEQNTAMILKSLKKQLFVSI